ncbi:MAG: hypothetical protein FWF59_12065 [Turicibacter sp.]|nr:hypothetical protein [Turicibacter sp.]
MGKFHYQRAVEEQYKLGKRLERLQEQMKKNEYAILDPKNAIQKSKAPAETYLIRKEELKWQFIQTHDKARELGRVIGLVENLVEKYESQFGRQVFKLYFMDGLNARSVADELRCPVILVREVLGIAFEMLEKEGYR